MKPILLNNDEFIWWLGSFHALWSGAEVLTCYAIGRLLDISQTETHILTAGMEFGRKVTVLRNLVYHSDLPNKPAVLAALNTLREDTKRNVLVHGFMVSDEETVTFIDRSRGGDYTAAEYSFTLDQFCAHVERLCDAGLALQQALGVSHAELTAFAHAALSVARKSSKSPDPPSSSA